MEYTRPIHSLSNRRVERLMSALDAVNSRWGAGQRRIMRQRSGQCAGNAFRLRVTCWNIAKNPTPARPNAKPNASAGYGYIQTSCGVPYAIISRAPAYRSSINGWLQQVVNPDGLVDTKHDLNTVTGICLSGIDSLTSC
jgi:hypothetical protein